MNDLWIVAVENCFREVSEIVAIGLLMATNELILFNYSET